MRRRPFFRGRKRIHRFEDEHFVKREIRQCFGKRMMNKQQALQAAAWMRKHRQATDSLHPYRCSVCGAWHVGNDYRRMEQ